MYGKIFSLVLFSLALASAADWYISPSGSDATGNGSESAPFQTLFKAVDQSSIGDTIIAMPGSYNASGVLSNVGISVVAQKAESVFFFDTYIRFYIFSTNDSLEFTGISFVNGSSNYGIFVNFIPYIGPGSIAFTDCRFISNAQVLTNYGGFTNATFDNCDFHDNLLDIYWNYGANLIIKNSRFYKTGGSFVQGNLLISNTTFDTNTMTNTDTKGSALYLGGFVWADITNSTFQNCHNQVTGLGGAIYISYGVALTMEKCNFINNKAAKGGAGVYMTTRAALIMTNCLFENNYSYEGGAFYCDDTSIAEETGCKFFNSSLGGCLQPPPEL